MSGLRDPEVKKPLATKPKIEARKPVPEWIMAVSTTLYLGVTFWLLVATKNANYISNRPWIGVGNSRVMSALSPTAFVADQETMVGMEFKNFGHSPATRVDIRFGKPEILDHEPRTPDDYEITRIGDNVRGSLFPGDTDFFTPSYRLSQEEADALNQPVPVLFFIIRGRIDYEDTFGNKHRTYVCRKVFQTGTLGICRNEPAPY